MIHKPCVPRHFIMEMNPQKKMPPFPPEIGFMVVTVPYQFFMKFSKIGANIANTEKIFMYLYGE